ncbi:MAG: glycosyltransferase family 2 protein [Chloroflexota bacterium]
MINFLLRGLRLLRTNPRLFVRRLAFLLRSPFRTLPAAHDASHRRGRIHASYQEWLVCRGRLEAGKTIREPVEEILLSVIMPVFNTEEALLEAAIQSVIDQSYPHWELCIADDASSHPRVRQLLESRVQTDTRIRVLYREQRGHIAAASNSALEIARGSFVVLLDHDDVLAPDALAELACVIEAEPAVDLIYTDEDKLELDGERAEPFFKPAWSPTLLQTCNYVTHLAALRHSIVVEVGGFRHETVGSQDHDLFLRVAERARAVAHVPLVLYSWRKTETSTASASATKPYALRASRHALEDSVRRRRQDARVEPSHLNGIFFVRHHVPRGASVSLIVLGRGEDWRTTLDLDGFKVSEVARLDDNNGHEEALRNAQGDYLLWLDATAKPRSRESVLALLEHVQNPNTAVVGGRTVYRRILTLQGGVALGDGGQPFFVGAGLPELPQHNFYLNLTTLPREMSAVYLGCCGVRRSVWEELQGYRSDLPLPLAMTDFCLRALTRGYDNIYTPLAEYESAQSLKPMMSVEHHAWPWRDFVDPFWNPNMTPRTEDGLPFRCHGNREARIRQCSTSIGHRPVDT